MEIDLIFFEDFFEKEIKKKRENYFVILIHNTIFILTFFKISFFLFFSLW
jgi:hypothetical protein